MDSYRIITCLEIIETYHRSYDDLYDGIVARCICGGFLLACGKGGGCFKCGMVYNIPYYTTQTWRVTYLYG
jgi:hypothetical protein